MKKKNLVKVRSFLEENFAYFCDVFKELTQESFWAKITPLPTLTVAESFVTVWKTFVVLVAAFCDVVVDHRVGYFRQDWSWRWTAAVTEMRPVNSWLVKFSCIHTSFTKQTCCLAHIPLQLKKNKEFIRIPEVLTKQGKNSSTGYRLRVSIL